MLRIPRNNGTHCFYTFSFPDARKVHNRLRWISKTRKMAGTSGNTLMALTAYSYRGGAGSWGYPKQIGACVQSSAFLLADVFVNENIRNPHCSFPLFLQFSATATGPLSPVSMTADSSHIYYTTAGNDRNFVGVLGLDGKPMCPVFQDGFTGARYLGAICWSHKYSSLVMAHRLSSSLVHQGVSVVRIRVTPCKDEAMPSVLCT